LYSGKFSTAARLKWTFLDRFPLPGIYLLVG
jgi:hypothetical protein